MINSFKHSRCNKNAAFIVAFNRQQHLGFTFATAIAFSADKSAINLIQAPQMTGFVTMILGSFQLA